MEKYKYPELTDEIKDQIFGLNAAQLFGVDLEAGRQGDQGRQTVPVARRISPEPEPEQHAVRLGVGRGWHGADGPGRQLTPNRSCPGRGTATVPLSSPQAFRRAAKTNLAATARLIIHSWSKVKFGTLWHTLAPFLQGKGQIYA